MINNYAQIYCPSSPAFTVAENYLYGQGFKWKTQDTKLINFPVLILIDHGVMEISYNFEDKSRFEIPADQYFTKSAINEAARDLAPVLGGNTAYFEPTTFGNQEVELKFKKFHPDAVVPKYANYGDACFDLVAISKNFEDHPYPKYIEYGTGLGFEIPEGHVGLIYPRSSISGKHMSLTNSVGVIDSGYRGEVKFRFRFREDVFEEEVYQIGDKVGQMMIVPYPKVKLSEVFELSASERGTGGFGSSGK